MCLFLRTGETKKPVNFSLKLFFLGNWICLNNYNYYFNQYFNEGLQAFFDYFFFLVWFCCCSCYILRIFGLFQVDFYHLIVLLGASSHFPIILE